MEQEKIKKGLVFGVFDGLHPGHQFFLAEAQKRCESLAVVVAPDKVVFELKGRHPKQNEKERLQALREFKANARVMLGDRELGSWEVLQKEKPDLVILGYDQQDVAKELQELGIPFETISPHEPEKYKTSLLQ